LSDRALRIAVAALATGGAAIAAYLTYARLSHTALVCSTGGCETVQGSRYAEVAGIPVPVLGLAGYLVVLATALSASELARAVGAATALAGAAFSGYLLYVQLVVLDAVCQWCLGSDVVINLLAAATVARLAAGRRLVLRPG
jgi:uncharacterized membrane protein